MSETNERSVASAGSVADEPAAWGVLRVGGSWVSILANEVQAETSRQSFDKMENWVYEVVPLYRSPTLTDEERPLGDPEIAVEILRLRVAKLEEAIRRLADQDATLSVVGGNVIVAMDATLTDAEREALEVAVEYVGSAFQVEHHAATLRGLLERMK